MILTRRELLTGTLAAALSGLPVTAAARALTTDRHSATRRILLITQAPDTEPDWPIPPGLDINVMDRIRLLRLTAGAVLDPLQVVRNCQAAGVTRLLGVLDTCNHCLLLQSVREFRGAVLHDGMYREGKVRHTLLADIRPDLKHL